MPQSGSLYADLSGYYDQFCAEIDYASQCDFAHRACSLFVTSPARDYLDLACGTGQHMQLMQMHGYTVSGLDNSAAMLAQAAVRCPAAALLLCDLAGFTHASSFDLITCFLYSIHYSHPAAALQQTLQRAWTALKPGGLLLFNAVDARGIRNDEGVVTNITTVDAKLSFQSAWHYRGEGEVLDLYLRITQATATGSRQWQDHHTMTALTVPQLQQMLAACGFQVQLLEHDYSVLRPWDGLSHNVIVAACKPALTGLA